MVKLIARVVVTLVLLTASMYGQALLTPTPRPTVTAENEPWFQSRAPLVFAGHRYYPAGAQVHFNGNEMVRIGYFGAIPIYTRTTIEPYSLIYVPLAGGVMQPYERRRSGDLAGTAGSTAPSFPIEPASQTAYTEEESIRRAPAPPTGYTPDDRDVRPLANELPERPVATTGFSPGAPAIPGTPVGGRVSLTAQKPEGLNAIFITFQNQRWFSSGPAITYEPSRFSPAGHYNGLPVYVDPSKPRTVYVAVAASATGLVAPYSIDRNRTPGR